MTNTLAGYFSMVDVTAMASQFTTPPLDSFKVMLQQSKKDRFWPIVHISYSSMLL